MTPHHHLIRLSDRKSTGHLERVVPVLVLALLAPLPAEANTGIGLFGQVWGVMFVVLVPVIVVEALVVWRLWKVGIGRALWWMTFANLVSTIVGAIISVFAEGIYVDSGRRTMLPVTAGGMVGSLLFLFVTSWLIEWAVIGGKQPKDSATSARKAAFVANAVSYALIVIAIFAYPGLREPPTVERMKVTEALAEMTAARTEITEHHRSRGEFPGPKALQTSSRYLRALRLEGGGRLVGVLNIPGREGLDGKSLVLEPRVNGGQIEEWVCHTPDADYKGLPAPCRQGPPAPSRP